ncbi:MAG: glycosyltransferase family 39 protein [Acidobacteriota bacterium]
MSLDLGRLRNRFRRLFISGLGTRERMRPRTRLVLALLIFLLSFATRSLQAVDLSPLMYTSEQPFGGLTRGYDRRAQSILDGEGLLGPYDIEPSRTMWLSQAPGYSIYLSALYRIAGRDFFNVQLIQNLLNSLGPVLIFLIAGRVLSWRVGVVSGGLAALSHHLSHISNFILPDSLAALPVLAALYLIVMANRARRHSYWLYSSAGLLLGLAAWLRPQTMLLSAFLAAMLVLITARRLDTIKCAGVMVIVSVLTIAPITIRNLLVYGELVPINIGLGIVLWEGIADASGDRFGAVARDEEVAEQDAVLYGDARYAGSWSTPDGIQRDRDRIKRSLAVIREHPFWYSGVMLGRMRQMLSYSAHAPLVFDIQRAQANERTEPIQEGSDVTPSGSSLATGRSIYWMRPVLRPLQRLAKEAMQVMVALGALACFIASRRRARFISIVPLYYLLFQSLVHTEFRYTLPMQYFVFVFAAIAWVLIGAAIWQGAKRVVNRTAVSRLSQTTA